MFDYNGAAGYGRRIEFDGTALQVVTTSDFEGQEDKRIWRRELTKAERAFLSERVEKTSRQVLKPEYRDPDVWDGLQIHFELRPAGRTARGISVANQFVEELAVLTDSLNVLLPPDHHVRYREWKEAMERLDEEARDGRPRE
ncbi:MAG TPA: hypothetical protein VFB66_08140 [Tepidisphaeraceae bacterium]|nr:hypothetical protein [Tepidisphaeraceae bacterium]